MKRIVTMTIALVLLLFLVPIAIPGQTITTDTAIAATLLIRFATLWFGVGIGLIALTITQRRLGTISVPEESQVLSAEC